MSDKKTHYGMLRVRVARERVDLAYEITTSEKGKLELQVYGIGLRDASISTKRVDVPEKKIKKYITLRRQTDSILEKLHLKKTQVSNLEKDLVEEGK